jgi:hypothetical protein
MRSLLLLLLMALPAYGQIKAPAQVDEHAPIVCTSEQAADVYLWRISGAAKRIVLDNGKTVHVWAPPGSYEITLTTIAIVIDWEKKSKDVVYQEHVAQLKVGNAPEPGPNPNPQPPPPGSRWALVVEETSQRTVPQANLWVALRKELPLSKLLIVDRDTTAQSARKYINVIPSSIPLPALVIVHQESGEVVRVVPVPGTLDEFKKELAR